MALTQGSPAVWRASRIAASPEEVARVLRERRGFVWLDSAADRAEGAVAGRVSLMAADPLEVLHGHIGDLRPLRTALARLPQPTGADIGLPTGGLFGSVDFDGRYTFGLYDSLLAYRHDTERWWECGPSVQSPDIHQVPVSAPVPAIDFQPLWSREGFIQAVRRALDYIAAGDIYQVNLSQPWAALWPEKADAFGFYERLRHFSPVPYGAFLDLGGRQVLSASPESFLKMSGRQIRTRPIKGTRPRRRDAQEDERSAYDLITSSKEIAELIMITDLERNDLGQVCDYGTVSVTELLKLERFAQVFHLVSTVRGTLRNEIDHLAALQACFPGGSISGAPKKRALEIIHELEPFPRGLYTGAIGYIGANGESQFSIAIRTAVVEGGRLHFHAGAGIVADSVPEHEWQETRDKASSLIGATRWRTPAAAP